MPRTLHYSQRDAYVRGLDDILARPPLSLEQVRVRVRVRVRIRVRIRVRVRVRVTILLSASAPRLAPGDER